MKKNEPRAVKAIPISTQGVERERERWHQDEDAE